MDKIFALLTQNVWLSIIFALIVISKLILDHLKLRESNERVHDAEKKAFDINHEQLKEQISILYKNQHGLEEKAEEVRKIVDESQSALMIGRLFNLYSKQIEKYQQETRSRASWSFIFAIFAMFLGMGFVFWGGTFILSESGANHVTAGASISAIGGGISAYITKTFLDVHRLSLIQLNRYFRQPVINDHILMAQRLAEGIEDEEFRKQSYEKIIQSITILIDANRQTEENKI